MSWFNYYVFLCGLLVICSFCLFFVFVNTISSRKFARINNYRYVFSFLAIFKVIIYKYYSAQVTIYVFRTDNE